MTYGNLIVTGGLGFIGKNFCLHQNNFLGKKIIVDKVTYASDLDFYYSHLKQHGWQLVIADVNQMPNLIPLLDLKNLCVINFAAESHVDNSFSNARQFYDANVGGTLGVIEYCLATNAQLLHMSTDEVYGEVVNVAATELTNLNPTNPYSASKAAADIMVQTYIKCFGLNAKIIRANNIFGPKQLAEKVIPKAIRLATNKNTFYLHGSKRLIRNFLHTSDFSRAILKVLETWISDKQLIYNIAGTESVQIRELVEFIYNVCGASKNLIGNTEDRPFNDEEYLIDDTVIRSLGWEPSVDFWSEVRKLCEEKSYLKPYYVI